MLVLFIVIGVVTYMKYRKGSLRLELDRTSFREGDTIKGTLSVKARKALHADEITLSVWCQESGMRWSTEISSMTAWSRIAIIMK